MSLEMDYASCFEYFSKALDVARKTGASANERSILCNLASVYYAREDTAGISYARQAYELSKEADDMYTLPPSIVYLIRMLMMQEKYDQAMSYMDELRTYYESSHVRQYGYMLYLLTADIKNSTGHYAEAEYYYKKALDLSTGVTSSSLLSGYRNYGSYLLDRGRVNEAGVVLRKGLELSREHGCMEPMGEFLLGLAEVSELSGDKSRAYDYYQQYHAYEEWNNISERRFNQLLLMFHTVRYQQEMTLKDQALLRNQKRIIIVVSFSVILSVVLVGVYMMYRKKNRMYRRMVENHYKLSQELARAVEKINAAEKNRADRTPDDILYDRIECLMRQEKVWIDLDGDGQMQEGEKVTVFGEYVTYPFSENVSVYGPVTEFGATLMQIDDIALSGNPHLERLDLSMCNLTDVDLSANVNLKWLDVQNNSQLEKLDVSHNAKLTYLSCSAVKITELDLSGNPELVEVHCIMTQAERIELGDITKIENLNIWNNYLTEIDLSHLSALKDLNVAGNELTSLDVSSNTALRTLNFSMMSSVGTVDLSMCGELEELYAYECGLKNVDFMKNLPNPDKLKILMVNKNPELSEMDLTGFTGLVTIHCYECAIAGDAMTALVESLPEREESDQAKIYIINTSFFPGVVEANEITDEQVEIAKAKNWQPYNQYTGASPIPL